MVRPNRNQKSLVDAKFVLAKVRKLIMDSRGRAVYSGDLDDVLYDIFYYKNFVKKLNSCYSDRDLLIVMNEFGIKNLLDVVTNQRYYSALAELTLMNARLTQIKREIRKLRSKGKKRDKDLDKEYKYLSDLYKDATKMLRKRFGIKTRTTSYKRRFSSVSSLVDSCSGYDYDDDISSVLYNSEYDIDDDDDDYDDMDELSEFKERYRRNDWNKRSRQKVSRNRRYAEDDEDDYDIDDEDDDENDSRLDKIESIISDLANTVQTMSNSTPYRPSYPRQTPIRATKQSQNIDQPDNEINDCIYNLVNQQNTFSKKLNSIQSTQEKLVEFLDRALNDDDDDDGYEPVASSVIIDDDQYYGRGRSQNYGRSMPEDQIHGMSREQVIDLINNGAPDQNCNTSTNDITPDDLSDFDNVIKPGKTSTSSVVNVSGEVVAEKIDANVIANN